MTRVRMAAAVLLCGLAGAPAGCGQQFGAFMYFFGPQQKDLVKAKCTLTTGPLLVLLDESQSIDLPPEMPGLVTQAIIDEFARVGINTKAVPPSKLEKLKRENKDYHKRGIREIGRLVEAEQVLWLYPREFSMADKPEEAMDPAKLTVSVKVINAQADSSDKLRVWPVSTEGELVSIKITPNNVRKTNTPEELMRKMSSLLAVELSHVFKDYDAAAEQ